MAHTPGPWEYHKIDSHYTIITSWTNLEDDGEGDGLCGHGEGIANVYGGLASKANARLIAAAPDLLEACEHALEWMQLQESYHFENGRVLHDAIAKAKGGA